MSFNMKLGMATSLAKAESFLEAIAIAREVLACHPDVILAYRYLAAWAAIQGDMETARWAATKLLAAQSDFTIRHYRALSFLRQMGTWGSQVAEALERAGMPQR
ncbi:hypothetical protein [Mesorhizobium sp. CN2-181]|uniref:hypothetical protein n=1 Tax=Mesorhizobium yinganensis TaxID=3157707 RepID=UPI0032B82663